jgi:tetratricopeptide (TPR) repeat protein
MIMNKRHILYILLGVFIAAHPAFAQEPLDKARTLFLQRQYVQAIDACSAVIASHREENELLAQANYLTAASYAQIFDFLSAKKNLRAIVDNYKGTSLYEDAYLGLGDIEFLQENFKEALKKYDEFLASRPSKKRLATLYFRLADVNQRLGNKEASQKYLALLEREFPLSFEARDARRLMASEGFYTVQVGAFINYANAEKFIAELKAKGYEVYSVLCMLADKKLCRVRIGRFKTMQEAEEAKKKLEAEGYFAKIFPLETP